MSKEKIAITLDEATLQKVRAEVRARRAPSVSAYISRAVAEQLEDDALTRLVAELKRAHGAPSKEDRTWARHVLDTSSSTPEH